MRNLVFIFAIAVLALAVSPAFGQITNLKVNGVSGNFSMVQGDSLGWEYNLPAGATASGEIWLDLNNNGVIDPATDKNLFGGFSQTDGDAAGNNGPGDLDGVANGHIVFGVGEFGLAPAKYIMRFTCNSLSATIAGTVTVLPSPAFTVSGHVNVPAGYSSQNVLVQAGRKEEKGPGWMALTNASGDYTINFKASAGGQTWYVMAMDEMPPYTTPPPQSILLTSSQTGIDFSYGVAAAQIVGYLKGEDGHALSNARVSLYPWTMYGGNNGNDKTATTDANGFFHFGLSLNDISMSTTWALQASRENIAPAYFPPASGVISLHQFDSLRVDLVAYVADDSITGTVTVEGRQPGSQTFEVWGGTQDSGSTSTSTEPITGTFALHVPKKIFNYYVGLNTPPGYGLESQSNMYHPGDRNVTMNLVKLDWMQQQTNTNQSLYAVSFSDNMSGWAAGMNGTVLHTSDGGAYWSPQAANTSAGLHSIWFVSSTVGWFGGEGGVLKNTTDGGSTWVSQNSGTTGSINAMQFHDANLGWIGLASGGNANILKTTNGGSTWSTVATGFGDIQSLFFLDATTGWAIAGGSSILKSTDGGSSWTSVSTHSGCQLHTIRFIDSQTGWMGGDCGTILKTTNGGVDWSTNAVGGCGILSIVPLSSLEIWAAGECGVIARSTNGGTSWRQLPNSGLSNIRGLTFVADRSGWAVGDFGTIIHRMASPEIAAIDVPVLKGWNMLSLPYRLGDYTKMLLFPDASSSAYSYSASVGYTSRDTMANSSGYWLKYADPKTVMLSGDVIMSDTVPVVRGWNMIGSVSGNVPVTAIQQSTPGMVQSLYYIFSSGYVASDTIKPGRAYWVRSNQSGNLILTTAENPPRMVVSPLGTPAAGQSRWNLNRQFFTIPHRFVR